MRIALQDGTQLEVPDGSTPDQLNEVVDHYASTQAPKSDLQAAFEAKKAQPDAYTALETSVPERFMHGMEDSAFGVAQLVPRAAGAIANGIGDLVANVSPQAGMAVQDSAGNFYNQSAQDMDQLTRERAENYSRQREAAGQSGFDIARLAGNVASPVNGVTGEVAAALPVASTWYGKLAQNAIVGGLGASTQPVENNNGSFADQKLRQIEIGSTLSAGLGTAGSAASSVVNPTVQPGAKKLLDEGIRLTPGQIKGGVVQTLEDKATSIPLLGDMIKNAQNRSYQDLNLAVAKRALDPIGGTIPKGMTSGRDLVDHVANTLGDSYDNILPKMVGKVDDQLVSDIGHIGSQAENNLPESQLNYFKKLVDDKFGKLDVSEISGDKLKEITSDLGQQSAGYSSSSSFDDRKLGGLIGDLKTSLSDNAQRHSAPELSEQLSNTDKGYANYIRMRKASSSVGAKEGIFSPAQLANSVKSSQKSVGGGSYARGKNLMQDLSDAALKVLPSTTPDSGSAGRAAVGLIALGAGGSVSPLAAGGGLLASAAYSKPGVAVLQKVLADRPDLAEPVAKAIEKGTSTIDILQAIFKARGGGSNVPATK